MAYRDGSTVTIQIETAVADTFVNVNGVDRYSRRSARPNRKQSVFMSATQVGSTGQLDEGVTLSGITDEADAGLLRLAALKAADTAADFKFTWDGTNGYKQEMKVVEFNSDANPDDFVTWSATLAPEGDAVIVGTGPIM